MEGPLERDLNLKAALLTCGIDFSQQGVLQRLLERNQMRDGTGLYNYNQSTQQWGTALAPNEIIWAGNGAPMRAEVRSNPQSRFKIHLDGADYTLTDAGRERTQVSFPQRPGFAQQLTTYGTPMDKIIHPMGEGALRVYPDMTCAKDKPGEKCRFCGPLPQRGKRDDQQILTEIAEGISAACAELTVNHIFMSTGAFDDDHRTRFYARVLRTMVERLPPKTEILFSLAPPTTMHEERIGMLLDAGATDLSFNLEAWNPSLWELENPNNIGRHKVARGKQDYFRAFAYTTCRAGPGSAKTNFIAGIEPLESMLEGFDRLIETEVIPSMTAYYPAPGSPWVVDCYDPRDPSFKKNPATYLVHANIQLAQKLLRAGLTPQWSRKCRISGLEWDAYALVTESAYPPSRVERRRGA